MKRKHQFHCEKCGNACEIYKKGKKHRVLVCPECGVIATNPGALGKIAKRAGKAILGEIPGASLIMEGLGLAKDLTSKKAKDTPLPSARPPARDKAYYEYKAKLFEEALR